MKCPKCHYLSFDPEPRCRNCGHTLSLDEDLAIHLEAGAESQPLVDLALRNADESWKPLATPPPAARRAPASPPPVRGPRERTTTPGPFDDLIDSAVVAPGYSGSGEPAGDVSLSPAGGAAPVGRAVEPGGRRQPAPATSELPLFVKGLAADADSESERATMASLDVPVIKFREDPLPPVPVRRPATESQARTRGEVPVAKLGPLDRDLLEGLQRIEQAEQRTAVAEARRLRQDNAAGAGRRIGAALIDLSLLASLGAGVVWLTLRIVGLSWVQLPVLPATPLAAFVLLIVLGYLFMFTAASGQTAGKMCVGIRVVDAAHPGVSPVSVRQALYREALTIPSVLLLGAGFLPGLIGDQRAVHDRLTQTRVVRA